MRRFIVGRARQSNRLIVALALLKLICRPIGALMSKLHCSHAARARHKATVVMLVFCEIPLGATIGALVIAPLVEPYKQERLLLLDGFIPLRCCISPCTWGHRLA
jgi:hypothetical protein